MVGQNFWHASVYIGVWDKNIQIHTLPLFSVNSGGFFCLFVLQNGSCLFLFHLFGSLFLSWVAPLPGLVMSLWQQSWGWVRTRPGVSTEGLCCESLVSFVSVKLSVCFKPCLGNASKNTWVEGVVTSSRGCEGCRKYKGKGWKLFQPPLSPEDPSHGVTP